jgi:5-methylcytosine-specific restriction endonuclease McrA
MNTFEVKRLVDYSRESIIAEIQRVADLIPEPLITQAAFRRHARVGVGTVLRNFGSFQRALEAAGLGHRHNAYRLNWRWKKRPLGDMSDKQVADELRRVAGKLKKVNITQREFDANSGFAGGAVAQRFGSWRAALESAGLRISNLGKRYSDEECFENLLRVWTHYGRAPKHDEMKMPPSRVGPKAYVLRWGGWTKALYAFVERMNRDTEPSSDISPESPGIIEQIPEAADRREIPLGIRYAVLRRDNFKCVLCGNSPARDPTCVLHVDHIHPWSKGGKTVVENLRTLCEPCNVGKGAKLDGERSDPGS